MQNIYFCDHISGCLGDVHSHGSAIVFLNYIRKLLLGPFL